MNLRGPATRLLRCVAPQLLQEVHTNGFLLSKPRPRPCFFAALDVRCFRPTSFGDHRSGLPESPRAPSPRSHSRFPSPTAPAFPLSRHPHPSRLRQDVGQGRPTTCSLCLMTLKCARKPTLFT
jgi:hypothetical protein